MSGSDDADEDRRSSSSAPIRASGPCGRLSRAWISRTCLALHPIVVVNRQLARRLGLQPGSRLSLRGRCSDGSDALPSIAFTVVGVAEFPFDSVRAATVAGTLADADRLCAQENGDRGRHDDGPLRARRRRARCRRRGPCSSPRALRRDERGTGRALQPLRVLVLSPDLGCARDGHAVLWVSPHRRAPHRLGEPAPGRDRSTAGRRACLARG